jgi:hypothetical protein
VFFSQPRTPSAENFLERRDGLAGPTIPRRDCRGASPTGHTYVTHPGSQQLFPRLCQPTAALWPGGPPILESTSERGAMMPKRRHTRAHNKAKAITVERKLNDTYAAERIIERNKPPPF